METLAHKTERLHSLDSLRAIMMLLGIVIHSAITYAVFEFGEAWPIKDPNSTHFSNDFIGAFIHAFRMQIFFVVSGFFGAMLFYERTPLKMLRNRMDRIVLPFIVFVVLLWPAVFFSLEYSRLVFSGNPDALEIVLSSFTDWNILVPPVTFHLWFLYYLAMITMVVVTLALGAKKFPSATNFITKAFNGTIQRPILRILVFGGISAIVYFFMGSSEVNTSVSFIPDFNTFLYYFVFYTVGWILFKSKHLLDTIKKFDWVNTVSGIILFTIFFFNTGLSYEAKILLKSSMVWMLIFGMTGLFLRYGSQYSSRMRYLSDSSYWVYLVHLPFTAFIPSLLVDLPVPATVKFLIVLFSTTILCYVSYHYLVRATVIGQFLNGRKYSRKVSDGRKAQELGKLEPVRS